MPESPSPPERPRHQELPVFEFSQFEEQLNVWIDTAAPMGPDDPLLFVAHQRLDDLMAVCDDVRQNGVESMNTTPFSLLMAYRRKHTDGVKNRAKDPDRLFNEVVLTIEEATVEQIQAIIEKPQDTLNDHDKSVLKSHFLRWQTMLPLMASLRTSQNNGEDPKALALKVKRRIFEKTSLPEAAEQKLSNGNKIRVFKDRVELQKNGEDKWNNISNKNDGVYVISSRFSEGCDLRKLEAESIQFDGEMANGKKLRLPPNIGKVENYEGMDFLDVSCYKNLSELSVKTSAIAGLEQCSSLSIIDLPGLQGSFDVSTLVSLQKLECDSITGISGLEQAVLLETLTIPRVQGEVDFSKNPLLRYLSVFSPRSIKGMERLVNLQRLSIEEFQDGDEIDFLHATNAETLHIILPDNKTDKIKLYQNREVNIIIFDKETGAILHEYKQQPKPENARTREQIQQEID